MFGKVLKNIIICVASFALCTAMIPEGEVFAADNINIKIGDNDYKSTLPSGYYDSITIDASKVYEKGLADGKANADVITKVNSITVNPGNKGKFRSDDSILAKTFTDTNMNQFTLDVSPRTMWYGFSRWNITFDGNDLVYTASWNKLAKTYYARGDGQPTYVKLDTTGIYKIGTNGGRGRTHGGAGASISGNFYLEAGGELKFEIDAGKVDGGGGYTGAFYRKPNSGTFYPLLVAGGGSDGISFQGGYDGEPGNHWNSRIRNGSKRDFDGKPSTVRDQNSSYNPGAMSPSGWGPLYGAIVSFPFSKNNEDIFYGGAGWRGGQNGSKWHWEGEDGTLDTDGTKWYGGMNTVWYESTPGTSHSITSSEAAAWGLSKECALIDSSCSFLPGASGGASATIELVSEE